MWLMGTQHRVAIVLAVSLAAASSPIALASDDFEIGASRAPESAVTQSSPAPSSVTQASPANGPSMFGPTWSEFNTLAKTRYGAENIDLACKNPFDSANPLSMAAELVARRAVTELVDVLAKKIGTTPVATPAQRKQEADWLRQTARHKVWLPVATEVLIGNQVHEQSLRQGAVIASDRLNARDTRRFGQVKALMDKVVAQLPADQPYSFQMHVSSEPRVSLAANMGGYIYVSEGLLRDRGLTDEEITLRLAHEISHVTKRHVLRDFQTKLVDAWAVKQQTQGDLAKLTDPGAMLGLVMQRMTLTQVLARTFDHGNELEADSCAIALSAKAIGLGATSSALTRLAAYFASGAPVAEGGSTHPRSELRLQVMSLQLKGLSGRDISPGAMSAQVMATAAPAMGAPTLGTAAMGYAGGTSGSRTASASGNLTPSTPPTALRQGSKTSVSSATAVVVTELVEQAKQVMQSNLAQGKTNDFALPSRRLGPATGNQRFPYGFMVGDVGGKYVALYDVSEQTVRDFNQAVHQEPKVMMFAGAQGAGGKPYAGYSPDSKFWILLPFAYLRAN
jgi:Zn-dependent protease with chaperone function